MKLRNILFTLLILAGAVLASDIFLVEDNTFFEPGEKDTVQAGEEVIAEVTFNLDREAFCTIIPAVGKFETSALHSLIIDEDTVLAAGNVYLHDLRLIKSMGSGEHSIQIVVHSWVILSDFVRLQVLVQYPVINAVAESPSEENSQIPSSFVALGPTVYVPGCAELFDAAGRKVECDINDGYIVLSSVPAGTYFAQRAVNHFTKIVKIE